MQNLGSKKKVQTYGKLRQNESQGVAKMTKLNSQIDRKSVLVRKNDAKIMENVPT